MARAAHERGLRCQRRLTCKANLYPILDAGEAAQDAANDPLTTLDAVEVLECLARVPAALAQLLASAPSVPAAACFMPCGDPPAPA